MGLGLRGGGGCLFSGGFFCTTVPRAGCSTADAVSQVPKKREDRFPPLPGCTPANTAPSAADHPAKAPAASLTIAMSLQPADSTVQL